MQEEESMTVTCTHCSHVMAEKYMRWGFRPDGVAFGWRCKNLEDCLKRQMAARKR